VSGEIPALDGILLAVRLRVGGMPKAAVGRGATSTDSETILPLSERAPVQSIERPVAVRVPLPLLTVLRTTAVRPLLLPFVAAWLSYIALGFLVQSRAFRVYDAGLLPTLDFLSQFIRLTGFDEWMSFPRTSQGGVFLIVMYLAAAAAALASWCWAVRAARRLGPVRLLPLIGMTVVLALPLVVYTGLFSDDVYLYYLYGRTIDAYGGNPLITPPVAFPYDPHLQWVYWKYLPSSYGPIWLMTSAVLSRLAGDSITAAVLVYRIAGLVLHLATVALLWMVVRRTRPADAAAATLFYAWNPLVLLEGVANAHNDAMVAFFAVLVVVASSQRAWSSAALFGACAVLVKPFAALLLPPLALRILQTTRSGARVRTMALTIVVGACALVLLSLPLWAGTRLLTNAMKNPASHVYTNTVWELISETGPAWFEVKTVAIQHPYLDVARAFCFAAGAAWLLTRRWARRGVAQTALPLWLLFCLTSSWVWPWYFIPAIALAALAGGAGLASAAALTIGGMVFWITWPPPAPPAIPWLHTWRSLVLFGPLLLSLTCAPVRAALLAAVGGRCRAAAPPNDNAVDVRLQTATG
jgi:hypothetical protein